MVKSTTKGATRGGKAKSPKLRKFPDFVLGDARAVALSRGSLVRDIATVDRPVALYFCTVLYFVGGLGPLFRRSRAIARSLSLDRADARVEPSLLLLIFVLCVPGRVFRMRRC